MTTTPADAPVRRLPIGVEITPAGAHARVWAPRARRVELVFEGNSRPPVTLAAGSDGYHAALLPGATHGDRYRLRLDDQDPLPDPASRSQPDGPHGPSQIIDPSTFPWSDQQWPGPDLDDLVLYELHVGTFTKAGTYAAAAERFQELVDLGVTCVELMPLAEFAGRFGWGYDGVDLFAPTHLYGTPDDLRRLVDRAHALNLAVILDVVYNHLGPDGNYLPKFGPYLADARANDWGQALNFDGPDSAPVREFFVSSAAHWIAEYHFDGFRFDATQAIIDSSPEHVLAVIAREARRAAGKRRIYLVNENEPQHARLVRPTGAGGYALDALWNDDFHHSARVALTGRHEAYYSDHRGTPQELLSAIKYGYLFQGQHYSWQSQTRGTPALDLPPSAFVHFLDNHDQVANAGFGLRIHELTSPGAWRALTALLLLAPQTPMLFQGQEFAASTPFYYFAGHSGDLAAAVRAGRLKEIRQFPSVADPEATPFLSTPDDEATFLACKLDHAEKGRPAHARALRLHRDLLALRRTDPTLRAARARGPREHRLDGAVIGPRAFALRFFERPPWGTRADTESPPAAPQQGRSVPADRLLLINLGDDLGLSPCPEPLLAPPEHARWTPLWSSEHPAYAGGGTPAIDPPQGSWPLPARSAQLVAASPHPERPAVGQP